MVVAAQIRDAVQCSANFIVETEFWLPDPCHSVNGLRAYAIESRLARRDTDSKLCSDI